MWLIVQILDFIKVLSISYKVTCEKLKMCDNICKWILVSASKMESLGNVRSRMINFTFDFFQGALSDMNEKSILSNLKERFENKLTYVSIFRQKNHESTTADSHVISRSLKARLCVNSISISFLDVCFSSYSHRCESIWQNFTTIWNATNS